MKQRKKGRSPQRCEMESLFRETAQSCWTEVWEANSSQEGFIHNLSFFAGQILHYVLFNPPHFRLPICSDPVSSRNSRDASV